MTDRFMLKLRWFELSNVNRILDARYFFKFNLFTHDAAVDEISTHIERRAVPLRQQAFCCTGLLL